MRLASAREKKGGYGCIVVKKVPIFLMQVTVLEKTVQWSPRGQRKERGISVL